MQKGNCEVALLQEPYVGGKGEVTPQTGFKVIQCTQNRTKPVKAAIVVMGSRVQFQHDPQLVTENIAAALLKFGNVSVGVISVYFEGDHDIEEYIAKTKEIMGKLDADSFIVGGDVNAWSYWWGSRSEDHRGVAYNGFLNEVDLNVLNIGQTPTFETYRGGKLYSSIVDVTACSTNILARIQDWNVDRSVITSDHNAIKFAVYSEAAPEPVPNPTTRVYNTKKADWIKFKSVITRELQERELTASSISSVADTQELEKATNAYISSVSSACEESIPKQEARKTDARPPWWSKELDRLQKEVLRRKRRIRNAAPNRRQFVVDQYLQVKEDYTAKATEAQTTSWKDFCTTQERETMWDKIYRVLRRTARRQEDTLLRDEQGHTLTPKQSAERLAQCFYPDDRQEGESDHHRCTREDTEGNNPPVERNLTDDDPPFTQVELDMAVGSMNPKKAPGSDGLTADICAEAIQSNKEVFLGLANSCLRLAYFPKAWKSAYVCILRKPGKEDYTHPKSYRPIGLLSVLGKILEKMLVARIKWHILPALNERQYGFMPQKSTEDALYDLMRHIRTEVEKRKRIVLLVSLDIEGAFDNAWWPKLKTQLAKKRCPRNLYHTVSSYLEDRMIEVHYAGEVSEKPTTKGCVQGSIGGPIFWNIILDDLLQLLNDTEAHCQAFADDVTLVFSGNDSGAIKAQAERTLQKVVEWGTQNKLNFAAHKTGAMIITRKRKWDPIQISMAGTEVELVDKIKLLGLTIDRKLTFNTHVAKTCQKATDIYRQLSRAARVSWGLNSEIVKTIYVAVIEPIVLYAASAWHQAAKKLMVRKQLDSIQRGFAQKICKAYRTVSLTSALILSGTLPLDLRIHEAATLYEVKRGYSEDYLPPGRELERRTDALASPHPSKIVTIDYVGLEQFNQDVIDRHDLEGPQIYTDGSKIEGKTGAALTWWEGGGEIRHSTFKLAPYNTVFQTEMYALLRAVQIAMKHKVQSVSILSDSKSSLELLKSPQTTHPLAKEIKESTTAAREKGTELKFFWLRAHVGTPGNERADELAKQAALRKKTAPAYDGVPISYVKRSIREDTVEKWQARYEASETGATTKKFFPQVKDANSVIRKLKLTNFLVQAFTGHGGFAAYLHRFKIKDAPSCVCDPTIDEDIWHIVCDCPRFCTDRLELEQKTGVTINPDSSSWRELLGSEENRAHTKKFLEKVVRVACKRNK